MANNNNSASSNNNANNPNNNNPKSIIEVALDLPPTAAEIAAHLAAHPNLAGTEWGNPRCYKMGHYWDYTQIGTGQPANCVYCGKPNGVPSNG